MPLSLAKAGDVSCIKQLTGNDKTRRHLEDLGLVVGSDIMIVAEMAGNIIVNIKGSRLAIDKSLANNILI